MNCNQHKPAFVFALNTLTYSKEDEYSIVKSIFPRSPVKQLQGQWQGVNETSYLVLSTTHDLNHDLTLIKELARDYDQTAFLYLDNQRNAYQYHKEDDYFSASHLGDWKCVGKLRAARESGYTFDPIADQYYIITANRSAYFEA